MASCRRSTCQGRPAAPSTRLSRASRPAHPTICCASATTRWSSASGSANGAGTGRCSRSTSASPISRSTWSARRRCCSARRATATSSPSTATCSTFRNCLLVEQPNGDFAQTIARHLLYTTWQHMLLQRLTQSSDQFLREFAHKAVKEVAYHRELAIRMDDPPRRRHRGKRAAHGRGARLVLALRARAVRGRRDAAGGDRSRASRPIRASSRRSIARRSPRCWPKRSSKRPPTSARSSAAGAAITASISAILLAVMQFLPRTYPDATW